MEEMRKRYRQEKYIHLEFTQYIHSDIFESVDTLTGTLWAGWGGRFRLEMPQQQLVSNGVLFWSYSVENAQVLVDSVAGRGGWDPLTLLYDPNDVYRCDGQVDGEEVATFTMVARDSMAVPQTFTLQVAKAGHVPKRLEYVDDNDSRIDVTIGGFSFQPQPVDSTFEFIAPAGVETVIMP